ITINEELRQLEYSQRLRDQARVVLAEPGGSVGGRLYGKALAGGAQALGRASGAVAPGLWADLVALGSGDGLLVAAWPDLPLDDWIFAGGRQVVEVWSAGRHVVSAGRHRSRERIATRYRSALAGLAARL